MPGSKTCHDWRESLPDSSPRRPALGNNIRIGIVSPYIVINQHRVDDNIVTILRVVHGRRRITGSLLRGN
jgi:toxin ParE1/3/4